jgi:hypothetical protein
MEDWKEEIKRLWPIRMQDNIMAMVESIPRRLFKFTENERSTNKYRCN